MHYWYTVHKVKASRRGHFSTCWSVINARRTLLLSTRFYSRWYNVRHLSAAIWTTCVNTYAITTKWLTFVSKRYLLTELSFFVCFHFRIHLFQRVISNPSIRRGANWLNGAVSCISIIFWFMKITSPPPAPRSYTTVHKTGEKSSLFQAVTQRWSVVVYRRFGAA